MSETAAETEIADPGTKTQSAPSLEVVGDNPVPEEGSPPPTETDADRYEAKLAKSVTQGKAMQRELLKSQKTMADLKAELAEAKEWRANLDSMPALERAKHVGADYGTLTAELMKDENPMSEEQQQLAELVKFKEELQREKTEAAEMATRDQADTLHTQRVEMINKHLVERDDAPVLAALGGGAAVLKELEDWREEHGQDPPKDVQVEIVQKREQHMQETVLSQLKAIIARSKGDGFGEKVKDLFSSEEPEADSDEQADTGRKAPRNTAVSQTLTNSTGTNAGEREPPQKMSRKERESRLMERLRSEGKL